MSEMIEVHDKHDYVLVEFVGEFNVEAAKQTIDRAVQACAEYGQPAVLLDCRKMTGSLSIMDRFQVAVYGQTSIGKIARLALVRRPDADPPDRFVETVAVNRGINLKLFTDIEQAIEWLRS